MHFFMPITITCTCMLGVQTMHTANENPPYNALLPQLSQEPLDVENHTLEVICYYKGYCTYVYMEKNTMH